VGIELGQEKLDFRFQMADFRWQIFDLVFMWRYSGRVYI